MRERVLRDKVDLKVRSEFFGRDFLGRVVTQHTGVVYNYVEPAEGCDGMCHC